MPNQNKTTIDVWHKNGIGDIREGRPAVKVYRDGKLADTNDKWENITIIKDEFLNGEITDIKINGKSI